MDIFKLYIAKLKQMTIIILGRTYLVDLKYLQAEHLGSI